MLGHLISFRSDIEPRVVFWNPISPPEPRQRLTEDAASVAGGLPQAEKSGWQKDELCELGLLGKRLGMKFSDSVLCTGYQTLDTGNPKLKTYSRCPHRLKGRKQCNHCRHRDISKVYTRLDFEGYEEMREDYTHQEFSVYLAAFGNEIIKCGVTRSGRVEVRTHEQGADYWAELMRFENAEEAYDAEIELQNRFSLGNFVRNDTKLGLLGKPKSPEALENKIKEIKSSDIFEKRGSDFCGSAIRENHYPVPDKFDIAYSVDGLVTGSKSQLLFYEKDGNHFVVPMYRMIGRVFLLKE